MKNKKDKIMNIEQLLRCKTIIEEIERGRYPSLKDLNDSVNSFLKKLHQSNDKEYKNVVDRTIKRDIYDIKTVLKRDIIYDSKERGYCFSEYGKSDNECYELLEAANLVFVLQNMENVKNHIAFDSRKAKNSSRFFFEILKAIKKKSKKVSFEYHHYEKEEFTERIVSPLGLKEFKGFWYLVAKDDKEIKTFGLDRVSNLQITDENSEIKNFDLEKHYEHCYGIVRFSDEEPQEILIKTIPIKASYYKANPLHKSQKIVEETKEYTIFSIYVYLTYDLQQELRSHGEDSVEIIQPKDGLTTKRYY